MATEAEWDKAQARTRRGRSLSGAVGLLSLGLLIIPATLLGTTAAAGWPRYLASAGIAVAMAAPLVAILVWMSNKDQQKADAGVRALAHDLAEAVRIADAESTQRDVQLRRQRFEGRLANALDMAEGEPEVLDVITRSFTSTIPGSPVEILLADNSHAHLVRKAQASPTGETRGCGVDSPDHCPAARRAQVQRFADSDDLDACPKLRGRPEGALSALCVPVSIMGRTVGVIHATAAVGVVFADDEVSDLGTLANLAGARIGLLRVMAETQLQAATDSLTGLLNRRAFEQKVSAARADAPLMSLAMGDLDHFKTLNDTYGHETGDRALRLFSQVLSESVRAQDLVCRHGGEEFVVALPGCSAAKAREILDAVRLRLAAAITVGGLPQFTVSFGIVDATDKEDLPVLIGRADAALFQAKRDGRDRAVVHDVTGTAVASTSRSDGIRGLEAMASAPRGETATPIP